MGYDLCQAQEIVLKQMDENWRSAFCPKELTRQFHLGELTYF